MRSQSLSESEVETLKIAENLAENIFQNTQKVFIQLLGPLGAGKTTFARGFIRHWLKLAKDTVPDLVVSPSYNLIKIYGKKKQVAHLDLYRLKTMTELEQLGFEHYFYEMPCVLVEWLESIPQGPSLRPPYAQLVELCFDHSPQTRKIILEHTTS